MFAVASMTDRTSGKKNVDPLRFVAAIRKNREREEAGRAEGVEKEVKFLRIAIIFFFILLLLAGVAHEAPAQKKIPSAEKIVDNYLKALGGKKPLSTLKTNTHNC